MQSASWYVHRLQAMSPAEVWWRIVGAGRDRVDAGRLALGIWPTDPGLDAQAAELASPGLPRLCDVARGAWREAPPGSLERGWCDRLTVEADEIARHRIRVFGRVLDLGTPIDWNRDHALGIATPTTRSAAIDYRDRRVAGDAKNVWEPNRHQHLVVLARAYRATGEVRYAAEVIAQLTSWLDQCPVGCGMNWRSPLELAIRLINWTWATDLIRDSGCLTPAFSRRLLEAVHLHIWDVSRKFSRGSSANNHVIGEAAGVFVATCYFSRLTRASEWRDASALLLCREIERQTHGDGGTKEQAMAYHLFVLQLHLVAGLSGRTLGYDLPTPFWRRLELMTDFAARMSEGGPLPAYGDADDGYVLDLGRDGDDLNGSLSTGALLWERLDFKTLGRGFEEPTRWLLGADAPDRFAALPAPPRRPMAPVAFEDSGYFLLQSGTAGPSSGVSVVVDCGPLGFTSIAAHGHADALSVHVRAFGSEVFVDPGTYDYFTFPEWREYLRSTRAHNTVTVDRRDQSEQLGLFLWGARAAARCLTWEPRPDGGRVTGEHDGYRRLADPVTHRRTVSLTGEPPVLRLRDEIEMGAAHEIELFFHLAPDCRVATSADGWTIQFGAHAARLHLDARLDWTVACGQEQPIAGWVSRGYHDRQPAPTIRGACRTDRSLVVETRVEFIAGPVPAST